jgi:hypothetical protein
LAAEFEPWRQAASWQAMHQRAVRREQLLRQEIDTPQAQIRSLKQRRFGRKNPRSWLTAYREACAAAGAKLPPMRRPICPGT